MQRKPQIGGCATISLQWRFKLPLPSNSCGRATTMQHIVPKQRSQCTGQQRLIARFQQCAQLSPIQLTRNVGARCSIGRTGGGGRCGTVSRMAGLTCRNKRQSAARTKSYRYAALLSCALCNSRPYGSMQCSRSAPARLPGARHASAGAALASRREQQQGNVLQQDSLLAGATRKLTGCSQ